MLEILIIIIIIIITPAVYNITVNTPTIRTVYHVDLFALFIRLQTVGYVVCTVLHVCVD